MRHRFLEGIVCAAATLCAVACSKSSPTASAAPTVTTVTLGPEVATGNSFHPAASSTLTANWTGFCPVPSPSAITLIAGNAFQVVNRSAQSVQLVVLPNGVALETIAAGATGVVHVEYGAVSQPTIVYRYSVVGCTDTASGQSLFTIEVTSK